MTPAEVSRSLVGVEIGGHRKLLPGENWKEFFLWILPFETCFLFTPKNHLTRGENLRGHPNIDVPVKNLMSFVQTSQAISLASMWTLWRRLFAVTKDCSIFFILPFSQRRKAPLDCAQRQVLMLLQLRSIDSSFPKTGTWKESLQQFSQSLSIRCSMSNWATLSFWAGFLSNL